MLVLNISFGMGSSMPTSEQHFKCTLYFYYDSDPKPRNVDAFFQKNPQKEEKILLSSIRPQLG